MLFTLHFKPPQVPEIKKPKEFDKNNLDDLLEDIQDLKFKMKYQESRENFIKAESTKNIEKQKLKFSLDPSRLKRGTLDFIEIKEINFAKLTEKLFPDAKKVYKKHNNQCFSTYIKKLKNKEYV